MATKKTPARGKSSSKDEVAGPHGKAGQNKRPATKNPKEAPKKSPARKTERALPVGIKTTTEGRESQIRRLKERLAEIKAYKQLIAEEGLFPDEEDKARESDLIVQLLRLEKGLDAKVPPRSAKKKALGSINS